MRLANYTSRDLTHLCVHDGQTILEAMQVMTKAGLRLIPVKSQNDDSFVGVVADGDIRRFLSGGGQIDALVSAAVNKTPLVLNDALPLADVKARMERAGVEYLPYVKDGQLLSLYVLWIGTGLQKLSAVIMAGGLGSRLAPLTDTCPKPLLPIGDKPILTHIIQSLRDQGVGHFVISVNYLSEMIVNHYGDGSGLGVDIEYVYETERKGTGGALGLIPAETLSDPFLCLNGDILNDIDIDTLRAQHQSHMWDATMVVRDFAYTVPYGVVKVDDDEAFTGAEEKPTMHFRINAGFYMLSKSVLNVVPRGQFYDLPTLFTDLKDRNMKAGTCVHHGRWIDIGNITELQRARAIFEGQNA